MEIIIGRDPNTNHLAFLVDGKRGVDSSVTFPQSISRLRPNENMGHCRILIKNDDIRIINLNSENVTYVDGEEIKHSVKIDLHSIIELGMDQYRISLKKILKGIGYVPPISIKHLKRVWEKYDRALLKLQVEQQKTANQQKLQGLISQASVLCVIIPSVIPSIPIPGMLRVFLVICALGLGVYFYIRGTKTEESFIIKKRELDERFKEYYVCPKCGYFFGFTPYENLTYKKNCPNQNCNTPLSS